MIESKILTYRRICVNNKEGYKKDKFVKIFNNNVMINTDAVINTNSCHIGIYNNRFKGQLIIASAIDNLVKGAAGQAVQNFNIKYKFKEDLALKA